MQLTQTPSDKNTDISGTEQARKKLKTVLESWDPKLSDDTKFVQIRAVEVGKNRPQSWVKFAMNLGAVCERTVQVQQFPLWAETTPSTQWAETSQDTRHHKPSKRGPQEEELKTVKQLNPWTIRPGVCSSIGILRPLILDKSAIGRMAMTLSILVQLTWYSVGV